MARSSTHSFTAEAEEAEATTEEAAQALEAAPEEEGAAPAPNAPTVSVWTLDTDITTDNQSLPDPLQPAMSEWTPGGRINV